MSQDRMQAQRRVKVHRKRWLQLHQKTERDRIRECQTQSKGSEREVERKGIGGEDGARLRWWQGRCFDGDDSQG